MFENTGGSFSVPSSPEAFRDYVGKTRDHLNTLFPSLEYGCRVLNRVYNILFDNKIGKDMKKFKTVPKNKLALLMTYMYVTPELPTSMHISTILCIVAFHELSKELDKSVVSASQFGEDVLEYQASKHVIPAKIRRIRETRAFPHVPSLEQIRELLKHTVEQSIVETVAQKSRKPTSRLKAIAFSAFFNLQLPQHVKSITPNIDHIVPHSISNTTGKPYDICRLGNLQVVPETVNKRRGKKPITDAWIAENNLLYQHYPSESEYALMVANTGTLTDVEAFNAVCRKREELYMKLILDMLDIEYSLEA
jgi:hypothetical protein